MMKRIIFIVLAAACCVWTASARGGLVILHTNDTHSHIDPVRGGDQAGLGGVIERAAYIDSVRAAVGKSNLLLLDAGDFSQGTSYFTLLNGDLEVELMNAMGYDVACLGNHEFDNGPAELARRAKMAKYEIVCANYDFSGSELADCIKPYTIVKRGGRKIGIIGLLTDVTDVVDHDIAESMKYIDPAAVTNGYAALLKSRGCDVVIVLSHLGYNEDVALAKSVMNVDLVIGGHSHTFLSEPTIVNDVTGAPLPVVTDGCWGLYVGNITIE
ncbi:MAG: metallophosphoesterase [Bacteroidales bacterium]|nr:metallophosphoesterase [Bacteroidales bacterium]MDE7126839.1 metallophosphoesterase [Bacteroidales bacterium]